MEGLGRKIGWVALKGVLKKAWSAVRGGVEVEAEEQGRRVRARAPSVEELGEVLEKAREFFKEERAPEVYIDDGIGKFLAMPIPTPSGLPEVVEAKQLMESGESEKAEEKIGELLSQPAPAVEAPSEAEAFLAALHLLDEGDNKFDAADYARTEKAYREASEMAAKSGNEALQSLCLNVLGAALGAQGKDEEALPLFEKALELEPNFPWVWHNKGIANSELERYEEALSSFNEALRLDPDFAVAWTSKGWVFIALERDQEALSCFDEALRLNPNDANNWISKGVVLRSLERYDEALASFAGALSRKPDDAFAWCGKGGLLGSLGRNKEALTCFDEALRLLPDFALAWHGKGLVLQGLGRHDDAKESFNRALALREKYPDKGSILIKLLTQVVLKQGLESVALGDLKEAEDRALELAQLRKEADKDDMTQVVDDAISEFKKGLSKKDLKQFRKFDIILEEAKSRD